MNLFAFGFETFATDAAPFLFGFEIILATNLTIEMDSRRA